VSTDPLRVIWDALEAHGCQPHGQPYDFRARCPAHNGDNPTSLHVVEGVDRRVVVHCFARQCELREVAEALGLSASDFFPDGHYRARRQPLRPVKRSDFQGAAEGVANVLYALEALDERWTAMVMSDCPYCGSQGAWLRAHSDGRIDADCPGGCDATAYTGALLGRLNEEEGTP
jgi:hypothetical protein